MDPDGTVAVGTGASARERGGTPVAKVVPLVRRVNRIGIGSLAGQVDLLDDWDAPQTNAEIAADFGTDVTAD
jgi:hypothetical protein